MSFVNLLSNDVWSDADIINRTEAMIASEFPKARIDILTRKVQGQAMGYVLTAQEQADLQTYQTVCYLAGTEADAARADAALLTAVMGYERGLERLARPAVTGPATISVTDRAGVISEVPNPDIEQDIAERAAAQAVVDAATPEVLALYALRHPVCSALGDRAVSPGLGVAA